VEQFQRRSDAFPKAWFAPESVVTTEDRAHFHGFAMTILMRRIADLFRAQASEWGRRVAEHDFSKELEPAPTSIERKVLLKQMLQICVEVLASAPEEDRALIAMVTGTGPDVQNALEPSERQRLRRLRLKIAQEISRRLGASVAVLLREIE
jgi:DNA-directed RNA polymerase specialized sigma24 family protein